MCSSSNGMSPFSQVSPFWNWNPSSSFCSLSDDDHQDLLHHHQDLLSYCLAVAPIIDAETAANKLTAPAAVSVSTKKKTSAAKRDLLTAVSVSATSTNSSKKKKASAKTDRHSKILTAQGPRDRRVRLSIGISRKFFGLQDLLGFDKASSTLDWLLTKSKTAIKELIQTKQMDNNAINATCLCSSLSEDDNNNGDFVAEGDSKRKKGKSTKKEIPKIQTAAEKIAKESRAKARERARERTREKNSLRLRILCQQQHNLISFNSSYQMGTFCKSTTNSSRSSSNEINTTFTDEGFFLANINPRNVAGESAVRNMKISKSNCLQRNLIEEGSSDFNNYWPSTFRML